MKYRVLNRFTGNVQFTAEIDCDENASRSIKLGLSVKWGLKNNADLRNANLSDANLRNANLRNANLRNANLSDANLSDANLSDAKGSMNHVKSMQVEKYNIVYTSHILQIGCERHTIEEWKSFDDERIIRMDGKAALKFWHKWKEWIFQTIEMSPAEPTRYESE